MVANYVNIAAAFINCNLKYFNEELPFPEFGILHSYRTCGYFQCQYRQVWFHRELYDFKISITDYYDFTEEQFDDILVHEMIHYYLAYTGLDKHVRHGKEFKKMAKNLNLNYNLNITPMLDTSIYKRREGTPLLQYWLSQII